MSRDVRLYLDDILACCGKIMRYTQDLTFEGFQKDDRTYDAVIRNLEIIGEAAKNIPLEIQQRYSFVEWRAIASLRNIVAHEYFGVKDDIIWDIIQQKIPALQEQIKDILDNS
jgi:uncharacterized protein with HEPN domain